MTNDPAPSPDGASTGPYHVFQNGQNLIEIAISHGVSLAEFLEINGLSEQSMLFPGQKLKLPQKLELPKSVETPTSHSVKIGETLISIADKYQISVAELQKINNLAPNAMLFPGTLLRLASPVESKATKLANFPEHCLIHGYHKVKPGDELSRIASFHGVSTQALLSANGLGWNSVVAPGSKIVVPIAHGVLDCPNLVFLSETSMTIAENLVKKSISVGLSEYGIIAALCLEMQRSGLLPDLGIRQQTEKLIEDLLAVEDIAGKGVRDALRQVGYIELAEGAAKWEPSAWFWLHQIGSKGV